MKLERYLRLIAGTFVLISLVLWYLHSEYWLILTFFVGINLFQSGFTNWCPMKTVLKLFGIKSCEEEIERLQKLLKEGERGV